ncbi:hypothetical protein F5883DRAFT_144901 [Diaporthe sp. PMI_573]|nr:hypothetical protein F5883DRAFT_144901 [Diaporthaceae sp. PMI_573]
MSYKPPHYNEALPYWLKQSATIPVEPADVARRHSLTANSCRPEEATGLARSPSPSDQLLREAAEAHRSALEAELAQASKSSSTQSTEHDRSSMIREEAVHPSVYHEKSSRTQPDEQKFFRQLPSCANKAQATEKQISRPGKSINIPEMNQNRAGIDGDEEAEDEIVVCIAW